MKMLNKLRNEGLEVTPLVAYGGVALFFVLSFVFLQRFEAGVMSKRADISVLEQELTVLETLKDKSLWQTRFDESLDIRNHREREIWSGPTSSLVSAKLQSVIRQQGVSFNLENLRVTVDPDIVSDNELSVLRFSLSARSFDVEALLRAMATLSDYPQKIRIDDMTLSVNVGSRSNLRASGSVPVVLSSGAK